MARLTYCLPIDVVRRFDPGITEADLASGVLTGSDDEDFVSSLIEEAEQKFDTMTGNPQRLTVAGGGQEGYEYHDASFRRYQGGVRIYLEHRNVLDFDYSEGDRIEVRRNRESWRDITTNTDLWRLNREDGILQMFGVYRFTGAPWRRALMNENVRVRYRHGALGGTRDRSGETTLDSDLADSDSTMTVSEPERLPRTGPVLVGDDEYVSVSSVNRDTGDVDVVRGTRGTTKSSHTAGDRVHYCPPDVRQAVASWVAKELLNTDRHLDALIETGEGIQPSAQADDLRNEWEQSLKRYSEATIL